MIRSPVKYGRFACAADPFQARRHDRNVGVFECLENCRIRRHFDCPPRALAYHMKSLQRLGTWFCGGCFGRESLDVEAAFRPVAAVVLSRGQECFRPTAVDQGLIGRLFERRF